MLPSRFSAAVTGFWQAQFPREYELYRDDHFTITTNPALGGNRRIQVLELCGGIVQVAVTPQIADNLRLPERPPSSVREFRQRLNEANTVLHEADNVFYFSDAEGKTVREELVPGNVRQLTLEDAAAFSEFTASASEDELDEAFIELKHWAVFGSFDDKGKLVCAASMFPWQKSQVADLGVLTLATARGKGHARRVVRAICKHAYSQGYEPQYRCNTDNQGSEALAKSAGFAKFAKWEALKSIGSE